MSKILLKEKEILDIITKVLEECNVYSDLNRQIVCNELQQSNLVTEGLIRTETIERTINILHNVPLKKYGIIVNRKQISDALSEYITTTFINGFNFVNNKAIFDKIVKIMDVCGWFLSTITYNGKNYNEFNFFITDYVNDKPFALSFDAKFDKKIDVNNLPDVVYHATPSINLKKINLLGLKPSVRSLISKYPSRVYFSLDYDECIGYANYLYNSIKYKNNEFVNYDSFSILKIDLNKLNGDAYTFMADSNSAFSAVYTYNPIPISAIEIMKTINFNDI